MTCSYLNTIFKKKVIFFFTSETVTSIGLPIRDVTAFNSHETNMPLRRAVGHNAWHRVSGANTIRITEYYGQRRRRTRRGSNTMTFYRLLAVNIVKGAEIKKKKKKSEIKKKKTANKTRIVYCRGVAQREVAMFCNYLYYPRAEWFPPWSWSSSCKQSILLQTVATLFSTMTIRTRFYKLRQYNRCSCTSRTFLKQLNIAVRQTI